MTEMSEKENEPDDAATHTPAGTVSALQETKVSQGARGLAPARGTPGPDALLTARSPPWVRAPWGHRSYPGPA